MSCKRLPMNDYYDVVIFGYLSTVQQYFRDPPTGVSFKAMSFRAMRDSVLRDNEYHSRAKRSGVTVSLDAVNYSISVYDPKQNTGRRIEDRYLLEQAASIATPREASIIYLLIKGYALREAARLLKMSRATAESCMENFCCRARDVLY